MLPEAVGGGVAEVAVAVGARDTMTAAGITHKRRRAYRPQTNGKVERFNRNLLDEWAYARPYRSAQERRDAFPGWLNTYNHHRRHTALKGQRPVSRVPNLTGQYNWGPRGGSVRISAVAGSGLRSVQASVRSSNGGFAGRDRGGAVLSREAVASC